MPWIDLYSAQWATLRIDRAEPAQSALARPDNAFLAEQGRLLVGWPTKLALSPTSPTASKPPSPVTAFVRPTIPHYLNCHVRR